MPNQPSVRVVVKLPYNRPDNPPNDPPKIEWTAEKADILWKVIERSRSVDSAGADWKGLAAHLEVPLPYLLYRVNARFQEEIRGLRDIQGALSPSSAQTQKTTHEFPAREKLFSVAGRMPGSRHLSNSRVGAPYALGVRARLNSLGNNNPPRPKKPTSSSTLTLQAGKKSALSSSYAPMRAAAAASPPSSDSESEDEEAIKEEEAERNAEEEEALTRKLAALQKMMTVDTLGLVAGGTRAKDKAKAKNRGRSAPLSPRSVGSSRVDTLSSRSQSISSASSPQGSIPDMPSPSSESQPHSPIHKNISHKSSSPPAVSSRSALGHVQHHRRYGPLVDRASDIGSSHGSEASSFSDLSDASISASALESALLSNLGNNGSRFSQFTRSRPSSNRTHSVVPQ
ncbi:hypothetical protein CVT25_012654 [Psilocybe cyanescens]|uniref:Autophagy-related protein 29 n=1 Tax=Psilocybe cyanescens TaxID=93625 RepID=A0A409X7Q9_PSICY|nr:hypothetical protein CVT25_012654 [Psilocybe cyanescens]